MYGFVITTAGEAMLARAAAGEKLVLDAVMVGRGVVESAAAAKGLSALIDPVAAATSTAPAVSGNQISVTVEYRNDLNGGLEAGFALSEFGISAHVGDDPAALLYYGSLGDAPQPVKPISEGLDVHRFPVAIAVTGEVSVTMEYPAGGFLTKADLGDLNFDPAGSAEKVQSALNTHIADKDNPHGVTAEQVPYDNSRTELASDTAQGAIDELYARMYGDLKVQVQVYETGTTTPISGVIVTGVVSETGGVCYANEDGIAIGYILSDAESATATVKVGTDYIDLTGQTSQQVTVKKGVTANATIYATRVSNPSGKIETFTASTQKMFTNAVKRVDVHCLGGGMGGFSGRGSYGSYEDEDGETPYTYIAEGGNGGKGGYNSYKLQVAFTPNAKFDIVVGGAGTGGSSPGSSSSSQLGKGGTRGGASNCLGVIANGGDYYPTGGAVAATSAGYPSAANADTASSSTDHLFGDSSLELVGGGNGGGGAASTQHFASGSSSKSASNGGSPYGGNGSGGDARGRGGGGAGGSASVRCAFCASTLAGKVRDLTPAEMVDQVQFM